MPLFPPTVSTARKVEFLPDGTRRIVDPGELARLWRKHSGLIPPQYALGTAQHESDYTLNEVDTEPPDATGTRYVSQGIFQLAASEADSTGHHGANLLDLEESVVVFTALQEDRLHQILRIAGAGYLQLVLLPADVWAYLSIAHNQGLAAAKKSISLHGLDWSAYQQRNEAEAQAALAQAHASGEDVAVAQAQAKLAWWHKVFAYGNDCISGGERWQPEYEGETTEIVSEPPAPGESTA